LGRDFGKSGDDGNNVIRGVIHREGGTTTS